MTVGTKDLLTVATFNLFTVAGTTFSSIQNTASKSSAHATDFFSRVDAAIAVLYIRNSLQEYAGSTNIETIESELEETI